MKILHIITSLKIGGAESALINFLRTAHNNPHEHIVAYFYHGPHVATLTNLGIATHHIQGWFSYADPYALWQLIRLIKRSKPNLIHSALWSANIIGRLMARWFNIPIICDIHGNSFDEGKIRNWFDRATVGYASAIVAVSRSAYEAYQTNILTPATKTKLTCINNGIDYQSARSTAYQHPLTRAEFGLNDHDFVIGTIGRLEPIKSFDILIKACKDIKQENIKLLIVGGGSQEPALKKLAASLGIANQVIFTGQRTDALRFYPLFDCFALSSQSEGLSIALLEALCFGLPVITTHTTKHHDVITHEVHGLLVPPNDVAALAQAISTLVASPDLQTTMRQNNQALVEKKFSLASTVAAYQQVYAQTLRYNATK